MSIDSTNKLLRKYDKNNYVPGEKRPGKSEKIHKQKQIRREKHLLTDNIISEAEMLNLTRNEKEHIHYLVDKFDDFNKLHRKASKECIILAFIFYVYRIKNPTRQLSEYRITREYGLTDNVFELIMCRIIQTLLAESPIIPRTTTRYDNEILYKTGLRK